MSEPRKLISFYLPTGLKEEFNNYCLDQKIRVATGLRHLIKQLIDGDRKIPNYEPYETTGCEFGFELPIDTAEQLKAIAEDLRLHQSTVLRNLMRQAIFNCEDLGLEPDKGVGGRKLKIAEELKPKKPKPLPKSKPRLSRPKAKVKTKPKNPGKPPKPKFTVNALSPDQIRRPPHRNAPREKMLVRSLRMREPV